MDLPIIPHEHEPGVECCGCLVAREYSGEIALYCNECGAIVVSGEENVDAYVRRFLGDPTEVPMHICPHCGALNTSPQFEGILAYTCEKCGKGVEVSPA